MSKRKTAESPKHSSESPKEQLIVSKQREKSSYHYVFTAKQLEINQRWLGHSFSQTPVQYQYAQPHHYQTPEVQEFVDETTTKEKDLKEIPTDKIKEFLGQKKAERKKFVRPGECLNKNNLMISETPKTPTLINQNFIKLTAEKCKTNSKLKGLKSGYFALYNFVKGKVASHPIPFIIDVNENVKFTHPTDNEIFFFTPEQPQEYAVLCVLYLPSAECREMITFAAINAFKIFDGKKIQSNGFSNKFIAPTLTSFTDTLKSVFERKGVRELSINFDVKIENVSSLPHHYSYTWSLHPSRSMVSWPMKENQTIPVPMITVSNINVTFKSLPKGSFVQLKAHVYESVDKRGEGPGARLFISNESPVLCDEYTSPVYPNALQLSFPDFINVMIDHELPPSSNIVIKIIVYGEKASSKAKVFGMSVIPLFTESGSPNPETELSLNIQETDKLPKDYLKKIKSPGKTFMNVKLSLPQAMLPNPKFKNLTKLDISSIPKHTLQENLIPLTEKLIASGHDACFENLYSMYGQFNAKTLQEVMLPWIFDSFDPSAFNTEKTKLPDKLSTGFGSFLKKKLSLKGSDATQFLERSVKVIPIILHILSICLIAPNASFNQESVFYMLSLIPGVITKYMINIREFQQPSPEKDKKKKKKDEPPPKPIPIHRKLDEKFNENGAVVLTKSLAEFIIAVINSVQMKHLTKLVHVFLYALLSAEKYTDEHDQLVFLRFCLLTRVCSNRMFITSILKSCRDDVYNDKMAAYSPVWSSMMLAVLNGIEAESIILNNEASLLLARICLTYESCSSEDCRKAGIALIPAFSIIYENYLSLKMKNTKNILSQLIPTVMFIIGAAPKELGIFFSSLDKTYKGRFITFLIFMCNLINEGISDKAPLQQKLFFYFTQSILVFLTESVESLGVCIAEVADLLTEMFNQKQPADNLPFFYSFVKHLAKSNSSYNLIIKWLLPLALFKQKAVRCFVAALLAEVFKADYIKTKSITLSSVETLDALTKILLNSDNEKIDIYKTLMSKVSEVSDDLGSSKINGMIKERVNASNVVADCIVEQRASKMPLDVQSRSVMKIADQYMQYPSTRHKWLLQIVDMNRKGGNFVAAFISQLHVIALFASIVEFKNDASQKMIKQVPTNLQVTQPTRTSDARERCGHIFLREDFNFYPDLIKEFSPEYSPNLKESTLIDEFTIQSLIDAMIVACELGRQAGLFYTLRQLYAFMLRLYHITRDSAGASKVYEMLSQDEAKIIANNMIVDNNLNYFLVEHRDGKNVDRKVFCTPKTIDEFTSNMKARYKGQVAECKNHSPEQCTKNGACIIKLRPLAKDTNVEFCHCFNEFTSYVSIHDFSAKNASQSSIQQMSIVLNERLPNYRSSAPVKSMSSQKIVFLEYLSNEVDKSVKAMSTCSSEFEQFFPTKNPSDSIPSKYVATDLRRIPKIINDAIKGVNSPGTALIELKTFYPTECAKMATRIRCELERLMKVYLRAVSELKGNNQHSQMQQIERTMVNDFLEKMGLQELKIEMYPGITDPMMDKYTFEEYSGI